MLSEVGHVLTPFPSLSAASQRPPPSSSYGCYLSYTSCVVHKLFTPPCSSPYRQDVIDTEDLSITLTSGRDWLGHRSPICDLRLSAIPRSHSFFLLQSTSGQWYDINALDVKYPWHRWPLLAGPCASSNPLHDFKNGPLHPSSQVYWSFSPPNDCHHKFLSCLALVCVWNVLPLTRSHNGVVIMSPDCT